MKNKILSILIIVFINTTSIAQTFSWLFSDVNNKIVSQSFGGCETKDNIHEGIDLNGYNYVRSICNGIVTFIEEPIIGGGFIVYIKSVENPELTISYAHLVDRQEGVEDNSFIEIGQKLGVVSVGNPSHVHLNFINTNTRIRYNPLINQNFSALLESVDSENKPILGAFYIKNKNTENYEKNYVYSKVNIIREVRDDMGGWYHETIPDYSVFSGNEYRFKGQSADPYKITFSINNTNYPNVFQEFLRINNLSQPNIELFDYDKYAVTLGKDNRHYFCRILTNSFTPNETNETGFDYEERPWQTKLKTGTTNQEALVNWDAEYPDGNYTLHMSAQDVAGNTTTDDKIVPVDNFLPFHRHVKVYEEDTDDLIYDSEWSLNSSGQLECNVAVNALPKEKTL